MEEDKENNKNTWKSGFLYLLLYLGIFAAFVAACVFLEQFIK